MGVLEWQPIETAPKADDVPLLLFGPSTGEVSGHRDPAIMIGYRFGATWYELGGDYYTVHVFPTHWMPLPEPP